MFLKYKILCEKCHSYVKFRVLSYTEVRCPICMKEYKVKELDIIEHHIKSLKKFNTFNS